MDAELSWRARSNVGGSAAHATAQESYAALVKESLSPGLRALGFQGSGGRYSLRSDICWALLGFQKSHYSNAAEVKFTVNLTVVSNSTWAEMRAEEPWLPRKPSAGTFYGDRVAQTRIGHLLRGGEDTWWSVYADGDWGAVSDAVHDGIRDQAMPWFNAEMSRQGCNR